MVRGLCRGPRGQRRASAPSLLCSPTPATGSLRLDYELSSRDVAIDMPDGESIDAYLTEEVPLSGAQARPSRGVVLLPDCRGVGCERIRTLADRLAVFCCAMVLVPDVYRGSPLATTLSVASDDGAAWMSGCPPRRGAGDVRSSGIYLRADHQVDSVALVGYGFGGDLVLRALSATDVAPLGMTSGLALCPRSVTSAELSLDLPVPTLCMLEGSPVAATLGSAAPRAPCPPVVMRFAGLKGACGMSGDDEAEASHDDEEGGRDEREDGIIMAEAWLNLQMRS